MFNSIRMIVAAAVAAFLLSGCSSSPPTPASRLTGFVYQNPSGVQLVSAGTRTEIVGTTQVGARGSIMLSPDAQQAAYSRSGRDLWVSALATLESRRLVADVTGNESTEIRRLAWSPDGKYIAILAGASSSQVPPEAITLLVLNLESSSLVVVASGVTQFAWLPQTDRLVFIRQFGVEPYGVFLRDASGTVTAPLATGYLDPYIAPSPDGASIVVIKPLPTEEQRSLLKISVDDGSTEELLPGSSSSAWELPGSPAWSPDGSRIALIACVRPEDASGTSSCQDSLIVIAVTNGVSKVLQAEVQSPIAWSPSGEAIAVVSMGAPPTLTEVSTATGVANWSVSDQFADEPFEYRAVVIP